MPTACSQVSDALQLPRSRRVAQPDPSDYKVAPASSRSSSPPPPVQPSPPLPPRSPLRPRATPMAVDTRSSVFSAASTATAYSSDTLALSPAPSFRSFSTLVDARAHRRSKTPEKPLPVLPPSPLHEEAFDPDSSFGSEPSSQLSASPSLGPTTSKRSHALLELLTSERSYAQDLCLIRDIHIPLAYGHPASLQPVPPTPPLSASSSRTHSTASDSSAGSYLDPPMSADDIRIIFNNVAELARFADDFTARLESALGGILEGGSGEDHVGALFLEIIPELQPLYTTYITRHASAIEHLNGLKQTPALQAYLSHTSALAQSLTHAWDLPSLLIKPVQRLLKYSLLLAAVIEETPETHGDRRNLVEARRQMEHVAHGVNEGRRRLEIVKEVLTGVPALKAGEAKTAKRKGLNVGVAASVNLGRIKSIRAASFKVKEGAEANEEAARVAEMGAELRRIDSFIKQLGRDALHWARGMTSMVQALLQWAESFGRALGAPAALHSDAFAALVELIRDGLLTLTRDLEDTLRFELLVQLKRLADATRAPERLLEAMRTLEPLHYGALNVSASRARMPPALREASHSYVALRGQLAAELPRCLELLHMGLAAALGMLQRTQRMLWQRLAERWAELWDALRVDAEERGAAPQTVVIWHERFLPTLEEAERLQITHRRERDRDKPAPLDRRHGRARGRSYSGPLETMSTASTVILGGMAALDSNLVPPPPHSARTAEKKGSQESMQSRHSGRSSKSTRAREHAQEWQHAGISFPMPLHKSSSQGRLIIDADTPPPTASTSSFTLDDEDRASSRGRKPGFKRRLTDTLRPSPSHSRHRRSPSLPSLSTLSLSPTPPSTQVQHMFDPRDPALARIPTRYECAVVFPLRPPYAVAYRGLPFFDLAFGDVYGVLIEEGHPASFPDLPLKVDDGEDCLLMVRNRRGEVGWALASFLQPVP